MDAPGTEAAAAVYAAAVARYSAAQIYAFALEAGFDQDDAVTMTAIALAESGGRDSAHATHGEDSRGLWQVNLAAHPELAGVDLFDPRANARAAYAISDGGRDISPWTTTHGGTRAAYIRYRSEAQSAAVAQGDQPGLGHWHGTPGYGHHGDGGATAPIAASEITASEITASEIAASEITVPGQAHGLALDPSGATDVTGPGEVHGVPLDLEPLAAAVVPVSGTGFDLPGTAAPDAAGSPNLAGAPAASGTPAGAERDALQLFLAAATAQSGDRYVFGATARLSDPDPSAFDCSELVRWAGHQAGVDIVDGALPQFLDLQARGLVIPVEQAMHTPGALFFRFSGDPNSGVRPQHAHVAISLGDGHTIEARGSRYGVGEFDAAHRFGYAALIPGISAPAGAGPAATLGSEAGLPAATAEHGLALAGGPANGADGMVPLSGGALIDSDRPGSAALLTGPLPADPYPADAQPDAVAATHDLLYGSQAPGLALPDLSALDAAIADALSGPPGPALGPQAPAYPAWLALDPGEAAGAGHPGHPTGAGAHPAAHDPAAHDPAAHDPMTLDPGDHGASGFGGTGLGDVGHVPHDTYGLPSGDAGQPAWHGLDFGAGGHGG